jgi:hypothetical protein
MAPDVADVFRDIEEWATLDPANRAKSWEYFALSMNRGPVHNGGLGDCNSWGEQLEHWIGRCASAAAKATARIATVPTACPRDLSGPDGNRTMTKQAHRTKPDDQLADRAVEERARRIECETDWLFRHNERWWRKQWYTAVRESDQWDAGLRKRRSAKRTPTERAVDESFFAERDAKSDHQRAIDTVWPGCCPSIAAKALWLADLHDVVTDGPKILDPMLKDSEAVRHIAAWELYDCVGCPRRVTDRGAGRPPKVDVRAGDILRAGSGWRFNAKYMKRLEGYLEDVGAELAKAEYQTRRRAAKPASQRSQPEGNAKPSKQAQALALPKASAHPPIRREEANIRARAILRQDPTLSAQELAKKVPCSVGLIPQLPAWRAVMEERKKGRRPKSLRAVSLTRETETVVGEEDPTLTALIEEQARDGTADGSIDPLKNRAKSRFIQRRKV